MCALERFEVHAAGGLYNNIAEEDDQWNVSQGAMRGPVKLGLADDDQNYVA